MIRQHRVGRVGDVTTTKIAKIMEEPLSTWNSTYASRLNLICVVPAVRPVKRKSKSGMCEAKAGYSRLIQYLRFWATKEMMDRTTVKVDVEMEMAWSGVIKFLLPSPI